MGSLPIPFLPLLYPSFLFYTSFPFSSLYWIPHSLSSDPFILPLTMWLCFSFLSFFLFLSLSLSSFSSLSFSPSSLFPFFSPFLPLLSFPLPFPFFDFPSLC